MFGLAQTIQNELIVLAEQPLQTDDRLIYLLHDPKPKLLKLLSGSSQLRLILETLLEVENSPESDSLKSDNLKSNLKSK